MARRLPLALLVGAVLAGSLAAATSYKIRFQPDQGLWVPYTIDVTGSATLRTMMGDEQSNLPVEMHGRFEDTVIEAPADGSRVVRRQYTALTFRFGDQEQDVLAEVGEIVLTYVREPHGILTKVDDVAPTDMGFSPTSPAAYSHLMFVQIPTPEAEVQAGSEWDSAQGLRILKGLTEVRAPTKVKSITKGEPTFAVIGCDLHLVASVDEQMAMPGGSEGQQFPVHIDLAYDMGIDQHTATHNGVVATWIAEGKITTRVSSGGNALASFVLDPIKSTVAFDQETYNRKKGNGP